MPSTFKFLLNVISDTTFEMFKFSTVTALSVTFSLGWLAVSLIPVLAKLTILPPVMWLPDNALSGI